MKFTYNQLAKICLKADGGYCHSCADDVAEGFAEQDSSIDLDKLKKVIDTKMKEHYKESERKYQEWRKKNPKIETENLKLRGIWIKRNLGCS